MRVDWRGRYERAAARYAAGETRELDERQLVQLANSAWAAGLSLLMAGDSEEAAVWLRLSAARYRESWDAGAGTDSWGRPIGAMKALLIAGDDAGDAARWTLDGGAVQAESPIGRYAAALACLVLGDWRDARIHADYTRTHDGFPLDVGDALAFVAVEDLIAYEEAIVHVLHSFETREEYLEDVPVADTVLVLQALAGRRGIATDLESPLLPA